MRWTACIWLGVALCASGCGDDYQQIGDQHVQDNFLSKHERREAIPFFEAQGHFFDFAEVTQVDREIIVPMLQRLREIADTEQWVVLQPETPDRAFALLVALPDDMPTVDSMAAAVQEADDKFAGFIVQQWGHEWLLMNLIDQDSYEFLKKSDPDIDKQR